MLEALSRGYRTSSNTRGENTGTPNTRRDTTLRSTQTREVAMLVDRGIGESSTVVDLGAGTGQFALETSSLVKRVVAVDVSPVMLSRLEAKLRNGGVENVECKSAGFLTYVHEDRSRT